MRYKTSASPKEILKNLDGDVVKKGSSISVSDKFREKLFQEPLVIPVDKYEVTLEAKGSEEAPDVFLTCTCGFWQYQGPEHHALRNNYLFGSPRGTASEPKQKDPKGSHKLCKHAYAVLKTYF